MSKPVLWIVIPCYNEEQVLPITCLLYTSDVYKRQYQSCASSSSIFSFVASPRLKAVALPQAVPRRSACA